MEPAGAKGGQGLTDQETPEVPCLPCDCSECHTESISGLQYQAGAWQPHYPLVYMESGQHEALYQ